MDSWFLSRVVLSFLVAGFWIALVTLLAERLGSRLGGLFTNLPSNILISLIFIASANGIPFVVGMTPAIPVGMLIDTVFLVVLMVFLKYGLWQSLSASLAIWVLLAWVANRFPLYGLWSSVLLYAAGTGILFLVAEKGMHIPAVAGSGKRYSASQVALRAMLAGGIVSGVVLASHFVPPYLTGIISTFPAVLLSTMLILTLNRGAAFARATGKILILSSSNIIIYGLAVYITFPAYGIALGTLFSFLVALAWVLLLMPVTEVISRTPQQP